MTRPASYPVSSTVHDVHVRLPRTTEDVERCRALVTFVYASAYGVEMTGGSADPDGGLETFPDRFVMGEIDGEIVACAGLYTRHTYVERHGGVSAEDILRAAREADVSDAEARPRYEFTKVVVTPAWAGLGLGRRFIAAAHARAFLCQDTGDVPPLLLVCAKLSVFRLWEAVGITTRHLRTFPTYRNHARYRRPDDPMESRLILPERDVGREWYDLAFPATLPLYTHGAAHAV